jgi:hypothetical protein
MSNFPRRRLWSRDNHALAKPYTIWKIISTCTVRAEIVLPQGSLSSDSRSLRREQDSRAKCRSLPARSHHFFAWIFFQSGDHRATPFESDSGESPVNHSRTLDWQKLAKFRPPGNLRCEGRFQSLIRSPPPTTGILSILAPNSQTKASLEATVGFQKDLSQFRG